MSELVYLGVVEILHNESQEIDIYHIQYDNNVMQYGGCCNTGFMLQGEVEMDSAFSLDENLQGLIETLENI